MKQLIFLLLCCATMVAYSQSPCDAFESEEITYYGLDFTKVKLIGPGFNDPAAIKNNWMNSWNNLIVIEESKYDLKTFFRKEKVEYNLELVSERNSQIDHTKLVSLNSEDKPDLSESQISSILKEYNSGNDEGIGLVYIVECFDKYKKKGTLIMVLFDIPSKKILYHQKLTGIAGGFGFRNYWAGAIYKVMLKCRDQYKKWKRESCK